MVTIYMIEQLLVLQWTG